MTNCAFCDDDKPLLKAHVIPEGFFRRLQSGKEPLRIIQNSQDTFPKRAPIGVYDEKILCAECEILFGEWDTYAQTILGEDVQNSVPIRATNGVVADFVEQYEYQKLKLFFISLLWRASVSTHPFYSRVNLGPFEEKAKALSASNDPGAPDEFSVLIAKFSESSSVGILDPHPQRWDDGVKFVRFYLGHYVAYIKVDRRQAAEDFQRYQLTEGKPLYVLRRNLERSQELPLIREMIQLPNNAKLFTSKS